MAPAVTRRLLIWAGITVCLTAEARAPLTYLFTLAPRYEPDAWMRGEERFPAGASVYLAGSGSERRRIAPDFSASADASVSHDGTRVLFAGKRTPAGPWQIWETSVAGGTPRQITQGDSSCIRPLYLPDGRVVYTRQVQRGTVVEVSRPDGTGVEWLTFAPGRYLTDDVLRDGRILMEVVREVGRDLFTVYPDGTGIESMRCDHGHDRSEGRQLSSGDVVFQDGARLARIRSASARQSELPQPKDGALGPVAEAGPDRWLLAARRSGSEHAAVYLWDASGKQLMSLQSPRDESAVQPVMVAPRTPPRDFPSALLKSRRAANVLCLNAGRSPEPYDGVARWVRVYGQVAEGRPAVLGQAGVEKDGSFFVEVPGDRAVRFELLDGDGRILRSERNWIWFRTGEQRICLGCHVGPEQASENRLPEVLRGRPAPVVLKVSPASPAP